MNMMDNMIGALSKSNSDTIIYFCAYTETDYEKSAVQNLVKSTTYNNLDDKDIQFLAIESADEMKDDCRLVGLIFAHSEGFTSIVLDKYEDLDIYMREIAE